jgi:3-hydroxy-D-aspartate aldolase
MNTSSDPPARVGMRLEEVDTPALLVDLVALESNLDRMAEQTSRLGMKLRPHAKTHKCGVIAHEQILRGAVGVCCQKVSEAEALVGNGVGNVLITNEVVDRRKLERLAAVAKRATLALCVDHPDNVDSLDEVAALFDVQLEVLIEVNVGGDRCGVEPDESALFLADRILSSKNLRFRGLQAYQGRAQHLRTYAERKRAIQQSTLATRGAVELLSRRGILCDVIAGGGTGTYAFEMEGGLYTELQPGSYIFMDADYCRNNNEAGTSASEFRQSLFVYTQVMSVPGRNYAIIDAGLKALAFDSGMPQVPDMPGVSYCRPSDEHGMLDIRSLPHSLKLGTKLKLIPGHCDPTVNLYDWYVAIRGDRVEALWPIVARGALS